MDFSLAQIAAATGGNLHGVDPADERQLRIVTDSRDAGPESIFWALAGETHDGHSFVRDAISAGVAGCVIEERRLASVSGIPPCGLVSVKNSLAALSEFANWNRHRRPVRVVGVTGSFGKTTTREMVTAALSSRFNVHRSPKNFNNHFGVPLTLAGLRPGHDAAVVEFGASAENEIRRLCQVAEPEIGIITGIGRAHVEKFGSHEALVRAKGELAEALPGRGLLIVPADDPHCEQLVRRASCRVVRVACGLKCGTESTLCAAAIRDDRDGLTVVADGSEFRVAIQGRHFARSVLFSVAAGREFGLTDAEIADGLRRFTPVPGRCHIQQIQNWTVIDDTYNASPEAMHAAIQLLSRLPVSGKRVLVTGDMVELGASAPGCHEDVGIAAVTAGIDHILATGQFARHVVDSALAAGLEPDRATAFDSIASLTHRLSEILSEGDAILIKGSRSTRMERVVDWLKSEVVIHQQTGIEEKVTGSVSRNELPSIIE